MLEGHETRNPEPETRNPKPGTGTRNPEPGTRNRNNVKWLNGWNGRYL